MVMLKRLSSFWLATFSLVLAPAVEAQTQRTQRDEWQKVSEIFAAMDIQAGDRVADIGAGSGFFAVRLSPLLGPQGRVIAVDIDSAAIRGLERLIRQSSLDNVELVRSEPDDPRLAPNSIDAALIVISYHEMEAHQEMLAGIKQALRPGSRLVIVDNAARDPTASRQAQMRLHHIDIALVERDLEAAGFEIIERRPHFIDGDYNGYRRRHWMLVATPLQG